MCELAKVSRSGFYRFGQKDLSVDQDRELRQQVRQVARQWPAYGTRRVTAELRHRGWCVNRKRVQRLMREENLLCRRRRSFVVTTNSSHGLPVYRNLAGEMAPTGVNQLWIADITYIRLATEFVYLAVILDACSRRVVGWALDRTLEAKLAMEALEMALRQRRPGPGLVHHSDRGVQYASRLYTERLKEAGILVSMSRKGNPWDNAACESFMKTLKQEEVYRADYQDLDDARSRMGRFLKTIYNEQRLHSSLDYCSPVAFERSLLTRPDTELARRAAS
jgi:putative transposase